MMHLHLDPLGGMAGDMFVAALLDAFPEHRPVVLTAAATVAGVPCKIVPHSDGVLAGSRFLLTESPRGGHPRHGDHHRSWRDIRALLAACDLPDAARNHATGIFALLAEAEAQVHGVAAEEVTFHEVGAADSIADIVAAGMSIAAIGEARWSVSALPLGSGRVDTAHGPLPVPAPATALLLRGFLTLDDGIAGERVTPTGAAILRYLVPDSGTGPVERRLLRAGTGFGTRQLAGLSNCLRLLVFEPAAESDGGRCSLCVIGFEIDDQTPEDLAAGLERLRMVPDVFDVVQMPAFGKKGRMGAHIQVLAREEAADAVASACFRETTTIGLRLQRVERRTLKRRMSRVLVGDTEVDVKLTERPDGITAKAESDDARGAGSQSARAALRREAEQVALRDEALP